MNCRWNARKTATEGSSASAAAASSTPMPTWSSVRSVRSASGSVYWW